MKLAEGFGVEGRAVHSAHELNDTLQYAFKTPGPVLIEANLD